MMSDPVRERIHRQYARVRGSHNWIVARCGPCKLEELGLDVGARGSNRKVIYDTREQAEAAGLKLKELDGKDYMPYLCRRSKRGHYHLTTHWIKRK